MRGGGTKLGTIPNKDRPICLDLTRLLSRTGMVHTGVDRVEWAYLEWCLSLDRPVYALVRSAFGYFLLDRTGMVFAHQHLKTADWGKTDLLSQFAFKLSPTRRAAEANLRKRTFARATPSRIGVMLRRSFPEGVAYLNTGHSNLSKRVFRAFSALKDAEIGVLIHDLIPLDWPDHQRAGTVAKFEKRMRVVSQFADTLICNSQQTLDDCSRHFNGFGRMPNAFVAHLGVDLPSVSDVDLPVMPNPYVITIGTIEPRKNHAFLLELWDKWHDAPHLVICGNRGWKNEDVFAQLDKVDRGRITELNGADDGSS
ncbi:glycosyltransferase family 1 protein [Planktotalea sp.]|uniref:glycosyltransferase family 1 protein n=1 Tax=Planktotalea sp. TaxID=2029877 RepID=UPI003F6D96CC